MKFSLFLLLTLAVANKVDPCWFIGLRLAKTPSICAENLCKNIGIHQGRVASSVLIEGTVPVTCESAVGLMEQWFADQEPEERETKRARLDIPDLTAVSKLLEEIVIPDSRRMLFSGGKEQLQTSTIAAMAEIDQKLIQYFKKSSAEDWAAISRSPAFKSFLHLGDLVIWWIRSMRCSLKTVVPIRVAFIHFYFDILSLFAKQDGWATTKVGWSTREAFRYAVSHRPMYAMEAHYPIDLNSILHKVLPNTAALLDEAVSKRGRLSDNQIKALARGISSIDGQLFDDQPAAIAIFRSQLEKHLCPIVHEIIQASRVWANIMRDTLSLIYLCRDRTSPQLLIDTSVSMIPRAESPQWLRASNELAILRNLKRNDVPWVNGLAQSVHRRVTAMNLLVGFVNKNKPLMQNGEFNVLKPKAFFDSEIDFEDTMKGLGRAIGLCVRYWQPVGIPLRLSPDYFRAINEEVDPELLLDLLQLPSVQEWVQEPIFFVRLGMQDVLGVAGLYVFSPQVWRMLGGQVSLIDAPTLLDHRHSKM